MMTKLAPGPNPKPLVGNLLDYAQDPTGFMLKIAREYGDVVLFMRKPFHGYLLNHPDYIKDVLVTHNRLFLNDTGYHRWLRKGVGEGLLTSNGDFHLRQRRLAQPAFHKQRIVKYADIMVQQGVRAQTQWYDGETRDMMQAMMAVTLTIVAAALFGANVEAETKQIGVAMDITNAYLARRPLQLFSELRHRLPLPSSNRFRKAQAQLDGIVYRFIAERRKSGERSDDLLSLLLEAQDVEGDGTGMSDQQLHDECTTLFAAGHETTAITLMWTWYALSQHHGVEAQLHAELATVLNGRTPTIEDLPNLKYTQMVLSEVLRLYPPAWALGRVNTEDYAVGGYVLPKGSVISLMPFVTQRDPRWYPDPERFDPQRWTSDEVAKRPKFSYYPFGAGPRQCIGESFAWMEATLLLATLAQQWRMRLVPNHPVAVEPLITLHAKYGMKMVLEKRET